MRTSPFSPCLRPKVRRHGTALCLYPASNPPLVLLSKWSRNPTPFHDVSDFSNDRASIPEDLNHQDGTRVHRHPSVLLALLSPSPARTPLFDSICSVAVLTIVVLVMLDTFVIVTMEIRFHSLVVQETIVFSNRAASLISDPEEQWTCPAGHFCLEGAIEPLPRPSAHVPLGSIRDAVGGKGGRISPMVR
jgi:hypothetical protein